MTKTLCHSLHCLMAFVYRFDTSWFLLVLGFIIHVWLFTLHILGKSVKLSVESAVKEMVHIWMVLQCHWLSLVRKKGVCWISVSCWIGSCTKVNPCRVGCHKKVHALAFCPSIWFFYPNFLNNSVLINSSLSLCWSSSLGKPRRFSVQFLKEEKEKLNQYRDSVRNHYTELREGVREGLPTDLARPLSVGQRVIAIHPETREIHDGSVLTVDHSRCRVQFDHHDQGVEFVKVIYFLAISPLNVTLVWYGLDYYQIN